MIDLQAFCADHLDPRHYLRQPFSFDKFTAASNGYIMIIVERVPNASTDIDLRLMRRIAAYFKDLYARRGKESGVLRLDDYAPDLTACVECEQHGTVFLCPKCDGAGEISAFDGCNTCEGSGTVSQPTFTALQFRNPLLRAKPPFRCPTCAGIGKQAIAADKNRKIGDAHFQTKYLLLAKTLPGATLHAFGKHDAALILFDAGFGILMPIRVDPYISEIHR
jgi:hypothetical protein